MTIFAAVFAINAPVTQLVLGRRFSQFYLMMLGLFILSVGMFWAAVVDSFAFLLVARGFAAFGSSIVAPASAALAIGISMPQNRGRALATVFLGFTLANLLGVPLGTWLGLYLGWRGTMATIGFLGIFTLVAIGLSKWLLRSHLTSDEVGEGLNTQPDWFIAICQLTTTAGFLGAQFAIYAVMAAFLVERHQLPIEALPLATLVFGIAGVIGNIVSGSVVNRLGANTIVWWSMAGLALMFVLMLADLGPTFAVVALAGCAFSGTFFTAPQQSRITAHAPPNFHGLLLALNGSASYIGIAAGSAIASLLFAKFDARVLPICALTLLTLASIANLGARSNRLS